MTWVTSSWGQGDVLSLLLRRIVEESHNLHCKSSRRRPSSKRCRAGAVLTALTVVSWAQMAGAASLVALQGGEGTNTPTLFHLETERPQSPELIGQIAESETVVTLADDSPFLYAFVRADDAVLIMRDDASIVDKVALDTPINSHPRGADFAPDGQMFGVFGERGQPQTFELRTIDPNTGATRLVGPITGDPVSVIEAIAFGADGTLYAVGSPTRETGSDFLYVIDSATGSTERISDALGVVDIDVLAVAEDGFLYGADSNQNAADLYRIDPQAGVLDVIGNTGIRSLTGLATMQTIAVPVDIIPGKCPNEIQLARRGFVTAAIVGTDGFDVTQVNPATVRLAGVSPCQWNFADQATPFAPFTGKGDVSDCHSLGPDRVRDLLLRFNSEVVAESLRHLEDGDVAVVTLEGRFKEEFGGEAFEGEDVVLVRIGNRRVNQRRNPGHRQRGQRR